MQIFIHGEADVWNKIEFVTALFKYNTKNSWIGHRFSGNKSSKLLDRDGCKSQTCIRILKYERVITF